MRNEEQQQTVPEALIYEMVDGKEQLRDVPLRNTYLTIPPKIVFEVDTKAAFEGVATPLEYYYTRTDELLAFGVEKVIWIFTDAKKIMIAETGRDWIITNWDHEILVIDEVQVNISQLLDERK